MKELSPLDGRYREPVKELGEYLSEYALNRERLWVEIEWLIILAGEPSLPLNDFSDSVKSSLRQIVDDFSLQEALKIKTIENQVRHDVKAVELHLHQRLIDLGLEDTLEWVHFAATSEDINNLAYGRMLMKAQSQVWNTKAQALLESISSQAFEWSDIPMLSHTHGQPATPTTLGKEWAVYAYRLQRALDKVGEVLAYGKWNGASGTFGAHRAASLETDWIRLSQKMVEKAGLEWTPLTTQIESHDWIAEYLHAMIRANNILLDLSRDCWLYISRDYLSLKVVAGEVGSSVMPHKVNPIDFENAEANFGLSNALAGYLANELTVSRLQRDLSDSSRLRNLSLCLGHSLLAIDSAKRGLSKISPNLVKLEEDLDQNWAVLTEAVQTVLRFHGFKDGYSLLKEFSRGKQINREELHAFINSVELPESAKEELLLLTPGTYIGAAPQLVTYLIKINF